MTVYRRSRTAPDDGSSLRDSSRASTRINRRSLAADGPPDGRLRQRRVLLAERRRRSVGVLVPERGEASRRLPGARRDGRRRLCRAAPQATARPTLARSGPASKPSRATTTSFWDANATSTTRPNLPPASRPCTTGSKKAARSSRRIRRRRGSRTVRPTFSPSRLDERPGGGGTFRGRHDQSRGPVLRDVARERGRDRRKRHRGARPSGGEHERDDRLSGSDRVDR